MGRLGYERDKTEGALEALYLNKSWKTGNDVMRNRRNTDRTCDGRWELIELEGYCYCSEPNVKRDTGFVSKENVTPV